VVVGDCRSPDDVRLFRPVPAICAASPPLPQLARYRRVLAVGPSATLATLLEARFGRPEPTSAGVRVHTVRPLRFDLARVLSTATVSRGGVDCIRRGARHVCSGASWRTVEVRDVTVEGAPLSCVFAHPSEDGLAIEVSLPPGVSRLSGVAGLSDKAAARPNGPSVSLRASMDGRALTSLEVPNRRGLRPFSIPASHAGRLHLELRTPSQGARSFCLALWGSP
jgi:hypothetical protein